MRFKFDNRMNRLYKSLRALESDIQKDRHLSFNGETGRNASVRLKSIVCQIAQMEQFKDILKEANYGK